MGTNSNSDGDYKVKDYLTSGGKPAKIRLTVAKPHGRIQTFRTKFSRKGIVMKNRKPRFQVKKAICYRFEGQEHGWYVSDNEHTDKYGDKGGYVHSDGLSYDETSDKATGQYPGWFRTRKLARKAMGLAKTWQKRFIINYRPDILANNKEGFNWYVTEDKWRGNYLHSDGVLRMSMLNEKGEFTGWYKNRELAEQAIRAAQ
jgi:hypothetical protein